MNAPEKPKRKTGRPPKFPGEGARASHSLRVRGPIDKALRAAAETNNRTIAEELEHRINASFEGVQLNLEQEMLRTVADRARDARRTIEDEVGGLILTALSRKSELSQMGSADLAEFIQGHLAPSLYKALSREAMDRIIDKSRRGGRLSESDILGITYRNLGTMTAVQGAVEHLFALVDPISRRQKEERADQYVSQIMAEQERLGHAASGEEKEGT